MIPPLDVASPKRPALILKGEMQPQEISRVSILEWANGLLHLSCQSFSQIPAKGIARIMNAMFGSDRCPLHEIYFNHDSSIAVMCNTQKVLELARRCGFDGKLDATKWVGNADYANELIFWRWLRTSAAANPIPLHYDFSLVPVKHTSAPSHPSAPLPLAAAGADGQQPLKRPRTEAPRAATLCGAAADAAQSSAALSEAVSNFKLKEQAVNTSGSSSESGSAPCSVCPAHIRRATLHYVTYVKRAEVLRAKIRQACEERNMELLLSTLDEASLTL
jgi:hypothetical protein